MGAHSNVSLTSRTCCFSCAVLVKVFAKVLLNEVGVRPGVPLSLTVVQPIP